MAPKNASENLAVGVVETLIVVQLLARVFTQLILDCVLAVPPTEKVNSAAAF